MSYDASVLRVCWDADSLFHLASTELPEERSATRAIVRLSALGFVESITSEDAVEDAVKNLHQVIGIRAWKICPPLSLDKFDVLSSAILAS